ncbi:glutathione S-transferase N-terminal domain-containing protein [Coralloluteibacterium stylophorae]|uniref:Glutathione S-transferase N-terminal domain-containing protein n=1 Tax=Coralloluteibacterium stylophorae TaxID=1776034 RepID=A0A8J7VSB0_9GAMM|nr:glutathione S-transferase N-terminal domain-containing protein [Coralloluteibacterium stylophorae]MBS7455522.1 glutathione S-transferase N-terminal domain-containing protein [Coralloluteibacterium stylophorae]
MIDLYTWKTPNGRKVPIALEELGLEYRVHPVDIGADAQFAPGFLAISPNNKIPAIVDDDGPGGEVAIFESGAILTYLAEKTGALLPGAGAARYVALQWLHWQIGGLGPMLGQLGFFAVRSKEKAPLAVDRFTDEANRLLDVLERRLADSRYLGGDDYGIADIAAYPWMQAAGTMLAEALSAPFERRPATARWLEEVGARPAVRKGMRVLED